MSKKTPEPKFEFKNDDDRNRAIDELTNLKNDPGWQRIEKYYEGKLKWLRKVLEEGELESLEELKIIRQRIRITEQFKNLPEILIGFAEKGESAVPEFDPYEKSG